MQTAFNLNYTRWGCDSSALVMIHYPSSSLTSACYLVSDGSKSQRIILRPGWVRSPTRSRSINPWSSHENLVQPTSSVPCTPLEMIRALANSRLPVSPHWQRDLAVLEHLAVLVVPAQLPWWRLSTIAAAPVPRVGSPLTLHRFEIGSHHSLRCTSSRVATTPTCTQVPPSANRRRRLAKQLSPTPGNADAKPSLRHSVLPVPATTAP
jgi:hypothetical protein